MSDDNQELSSTVEVAVPVPDEEWLRDRMDTTRFNTFGDLVTQLLDETAVIAEEMQDVEMDDEITVTLPSDSHNQYEKLQNHFDEMADKESLEDLLSILVTQLYVQERAKLGGL